MRHGRKITYLPPMMRFGSFILFPSPTWLSVGIVLLMVGACAPSAPIVERRPVSDDGVSQSRVRSDISFLDGAEPEGRRTASRGFTRTASYLAGQMREAGLQPVLSGEYRIQYASTIRRASEASVQWLGRDTTRAVRGEDFLITDRPDAFSGRGSVSDLPDFDWLIWNTEVTESRDGKQEWTMQVKMEERVSTAPMHVVGLIPGAHPVSRDSLVVVLAPVDGSGLQGSGSWTDGSDLSIPAVSVLSAMRQAAAHQETWTLYSQTIMVALLSGSSEECQGPDAFFRHFPWDRSMVSQVVVVSMQTESNCDWQALWQRHVGIGSGPKIVVLRAYAPFPKSADSGFGQWRPRSESLLPDALEVGTNEALRLAREIMSLLP